MTQHNIAEPVAEIITFFMKCEDYFLNLSATQTYRLSDCKNLFHFQNLENEFLKSIYKMK